MKQKEEEQKYTCRSLKNVKPVAAIAVIEHIRLGLGRDHDAVDRMENQRQKYPEDLNKQQIRHIMNGLDMLVKNPCTIHRGRISEHVYEKEHAQRHNTRELVQLS